LVLIATSPENHQELVKKFGLLINTDKTKVMACGNNGTSTKINLCGEVLEEVESFVYLNSIFTSDGNCTQNIRKRLAMERSAMQSLSSALKSRHFHNHKSQVAKSIGLVNCNIRQVGQQSDIFIK